MRVNAVIISTMPGSSVTAVIRIRICSVSEYCLTATGRGRHRHGRNALRRAHDVEQSGSIGSSATAMTQAHSTARTFEPTHHSPRLRFRIDLKSGRCGECGMPAASPLLLPPL